jgi:DNA-binding transcriptional MerR regulator/methylmalonyl-CoA mutase cobalamin-binding subunit
MRVNERKSAATGQGHDRLPLRTVAAITGLSPDVIRAWEKRYAAVHPIRGPRGARLYTRQDIEHLRLLAQAVSHGRAIGDVAALDRSSLARITTTEPAPAAHNDERLDPLIDVVRALDVNALENRLGDTLIALGATRFAAEIASPLLERVGDLWRRGDLSIAAEHALSGVLRNLIGALLRERRPVGGPMVLLAAPRGEEHEFGLLFSALIFVHNGCGVCHLGVSVPAEDIVHAATRMPAHAVGISVVNEANRAVATREISLVERGLHPVTELWFGGRDATNVARRLGATRARVLGHHPGEIEDRARALRYAQLSSPFKKAV